MAARRHVPEGRTPGLPAFRICRVCFSRWALGSIVLIRYNIQINNISLTRNALKQTRQTRKPGNGANSVAAVCYRTRSNLLGVAQ
jgi:prenyltransferase beta subunit